MAYDTSSSDRSDNRPARSGPATDDRRQSFRTDAHKLGTVRVFPDTGAPGFKAKLLDVSAGGIGLLMDRGLRLGQQFLFQPFTSGGASMTLLYRAVRCEPRGNEFLVGGILVSASGELERDAKGGIAPADLERIRRSMTGM